MTATVATETVKGALAATGPSRVGPLAAFATLRAVPCHLVVFRYARDSASSLTGVTLSGSMRTMR